MLMADVVDERVSHLPVNDRPVGRCRDLRRVPRSVTVAASTQGEVIKEGLSEVIHPAQGDLGLLLEHLGDVLDAPGLADEAILDHYSSGPVSSARWSAPPIPRRERGRGSREAIHDRHRMDADGEITAETKLSEVVRRRARCGNHPGAAAGRAGSASLPASGSAPPQPANHGHNRQSDALFHGQTIKRQDHRKDDLLL